MRTVDQLVLAVAIVLGLVWTMGAIGAVQSQASAYRSIQSIK